MAKQKPREWDRFTGEPVPLNDPTPEEPPNGWGETEGGADAQLKAEEQADGPS